MSDPKRLVDDPRDPSVVRALHAGIAMDPPAGAETAVWEALTTSVQAGEGASASAEAAGAGKSAGGLGGAFTHGPWWWLSVLGVTLAGAGGYAVLRNVSNAPPERARTEVAKNRSSDPAHGGTLVKHEDETEPIPRVALDDLAQENAAAPGSAPKRAADRAPASDAAALPSATPPGVTEGELVLGARKALRAGRSSDALRLIARARAEFPTGELAQERDALEIEALVRSGALEAARSRASEFSLRYPKSPYAKNVGVLVR